MRDLKFISGNFLETSIPKDKRFLKKYFRTHIQKVFLRYYLDFGDTSCFVPHTGCWTTRSHLYRLVQRYLNVLDAHRRAKADMDLALVHSIETGGYKDYRKLGWMRRD